MSQTRSTCYGNRPEPGSRYLNGHIGPAPQLGSILSRAWEKPRRSHEKAIPLDSYGAHFALSACTQAVDTTTTAGAPPPPRRARPPPPMRAPLPPKPPRPRRQPPAVNYWQRCNPGAACCAGSTKRFRASASAIRMARLSGFDIDFCKAVAAAVLGDPEAVEYVALTAQQRFTALQSGEIDVLIRNTTYTASRDGGEGATFLHTTFYDGQGMMVRADSGITDSGGPGQYRDLCPLGYDDRIEPGNPLRRHSVRTPDLRRK